MAGDISLGLTGEIVLPAEGLAEVRRSGWEPWTKR